MVMRAHHLAQPEDMPVACYRTKKAPLLFITSSRIATLLRDAVKKVQPSTSADDLKKYSAHSFHVWVCVLLDEVGMSPSFIQKHLCWLGDSFKMYLHDTKALQDKHLAALQLASTDIMALIRTLLGDVVHLTATMSDLNIPSNVVKDDSTLMKWTKKNKSTHTLMTPFSFYILLSYIINWFLHRSSFEATRHRLPHTHPPHPPRYPVT